MEAEKELEFYHNVRIRFHRNERGTRMYISLDLQVFFKKASHSFLIITVT